MLGGFLVEFTSWRAVFLVNVPVGLAAMLLTPRLLGRGRERRVRRRLDIGGAVLITAVVAAVVFAVSEGGAAGWASPPVLAAAGRPGRADRAEPGPPGPAQARPVRTITGGMPR